MAEDQGRWVLTRDIGFVQSRYTELVYWVQADNKKLQAEEIIEAFQLDLARQSLLSRWGFGVEETRTGVSRSASRDPAPRVVLLGDSADPGPMESCPQTTKPADTCRCAKCNGNFLPEPVGPADVQSSQVPEGVLLRQTEFWVCSKCRSVYWQGSQYESAISRLTQMTMRLSLKTC